MLWVALSAFIMSITGKGDDTFAFRKALERVEAAVEREVDDPNHRQKALTSLARARKSFTDHRVRTSRISACLERADRSYGTSAAEYQRCLVDARRAWDIAAEELVVIDRAFRASLTPAEYGAVCRSAQR